MIGGNPVYCIYMLMPSEQLKPKTQYPRHKTARNLIISHMPTTRPVTCGIPSRECKHTEEHNNRAVAGTHTEHKPAEQPTQTDITTKYTDCYPAIAQTTESDQLYSTCRR